MSNISFRIYAVITCSLFFSNCAIASDLPYKEGELLVRFAKKPDGKIPTISDRNNILASVNAGTVQKSYSIVQGLTLVKLPANIAVVQALHELQEKKGILYVEPNYKIKFRSTEPNDEFFSGQWALYNPGGQYNQTEDADIDANEAWDFVTHSNIIVAVLDSGIDYNHPDLADNIWINQAELNGTSGVDDDGNGYVDDIYGYDFGSDDSYPMDFKGHGTHVAGIVGAVGNNGIGVTGICWNIKMIATKIGTDFGGPDVSAAIEAIQYSILMGAKVLNNSWGIDYYSQSLKDAIEAADENGVLFVCAVGYGPSNIDSNDVNDYPPEYDCNNIISVLATDFEDNKSENSNYGQTSVDLGAPGGEYISGYPPAAIYSTWPGGEYYWSSGTSMAAPHVAGACALVWSAHPGWSYLQVKNEILSSVDVLPALDGKCVTGGRLNLYKAVTAHPMPDFNITDDITGCVMPFTTINYTIHYDPCDNTDTDVNIISELPIGVDYSSSSDGGSYNPNDRTVTWSISPFGPDNPDDITLTVTVNLDAEPGGTLTNNCRLQGDNYFLIDSETTDVCCWRHIVYVDDDAGPNGDGLSWDTAFKDINTALDFVENNQCYDRIYVAAGTYEPVEGTFEMTDDVALYGHFNGETDPAKRDLSNPAYETKLQGENGSNVVTAYGITGALLDGFTITGAYESYDCGIYIDNQADISIVNCRIKNNYYGLGINNSSLADIHNCRFSSAESGIKAYSSTLNISNSIFTGHTNDSINASSTYLTVTDSNFFEDNSYAIYSFSNFGQTNISGCLIQNEGGSGIFCMGNNVTVTDCNIMNCLYGLGTAETDVDVIHCYIHGNEYRGINASQGDVLIKRSFFYENDDSGDDAAIYLYSSGNDNVKILNNWVYRNKNGIHLESSSSISPKIRNNTITDNTETGIYSTGTDPVIKNCILWGNDTELSSGLIASYSCIQGGDANNNNINSDPCFNTTYDDYHLTGVSPCIDTGNGTYDETDIDGEKRVMDGDYDRTEVVDRGADEYYWPKADYNGDGIVNFIDFSKFANNWLDVNAAISFDTDSNVDINDLSLFCEDWLWEAPWGKGLPFFCMGGGGMFVSESFFAGDDLMFSDICESLDAMPDSLYSKIEKFYAVTPASQPKSPQQRSALISELLEWLDGLWESGELQDYLTYEEYLEFRESIKQSAESE
jgi:parallel beta-helix repeat protein